MKNLYIIVICICLSCFKTFGQCTPDATLNTYGFSPAELPFAYTDAPYNEVLSFLVPKDTSVKLNNVVFPVVIDSMRLESMSGYPEGFTYECLNNCVVPGGQRGCTKLSGSATEAQIGLYPIYTKTKIFYKINGAGSQFDRTDSVRATTFRIYKTTGLAQIASGNFNAAVKVYPNPAKTIIETDLSYLPANTNGEVIVIDALGKTVYTAEVKHNHTAAVNVSNFKTGLYKMAFITNKGNYYSSFIKE